MWCGHGEVLGTINLFHFILFESRKIILHASDYGQLHLVVMMTMMMMMVMMFVWP